MDACIFTGCTNALAPDSTIVCVEHNADLRAGCPDEDCPVHGEPERVLIYGSRSWDDPEPIRALIDSLPSNAVVIHGGARGADNLAARLASERGLRVECFPADWQKHGRAAGPIRNQEMIGDGRPTRAYGWRRPGPSTGTDDMTSRLVRAGIPHEVRTATVVAKGSQRVTAPESCPHCGRRSIARSYPLTARVWRCQAPATLCGKQFGAMA